MAGKSKAKPAEVTEEINGVVLDDDAIPVSEPAAETQIEEATEEAPFYIYLGPTIQGVIQNATIYTGTREEVLKKLERPIAKYPRIKVLLVSGNRVVEDRDNVNRPGTRLYAEYHRLVYELKK